MDLVMLGHGPFEIYPIYQFLKKSEMSFKLICENRQQLSYSLGLGGAEVAQLKERLDSGESALQDIPREILRVWKRNHKDNATLKMLYDALIDMELNDVAVSIKSKFIGSSEVLHSQNGPAPKKVKFLKTEEQNSSTKNDPSIPIEKRRSDFLSAIREGESLSRLKEILEEGANVNQSSDDGNNAAHLLIASVLNRKRSIQETLDILGFLVSKGFVLIDQPNKNMITPLHFALRTKDLTVGFLDFFKEQSAAFNAEDNKGNYLLSTAIETGHGSAIIQKLIDCGSKPECMGIYKKNVLHISATCGNHSAMEAFIEKAKVNVNEQDLHGFTPLHWLFQRKNVDYGPSLKLLLDNNADFQIEDNLGLVPLLKWITRYDPSDFFATLMIFKDRLPINSKIVSQVLTLILKLMPVMVKFMPLPSSKKQTDFGKFIMFLIDEKEGKLLLKEDIWNCDMTSREKLEKIMVGPCFFKELGKRVKVKILCSLSDANRLDKIVLDSESNNINVPFEHVMYALLACKDYDHFLAVCSFLTQFCDLSLLTLKKQSDS